MGIDAAELALFSEADLDVYGVMPEAIAGVSSEIKAARIAAAIDQVLSWIPNCTRPVSAIGEYLKETIGLVASARIMRWNRGTRAADQATLDALDKRIAEERDLIMAAGDSKGIRLEFTDSTADDDFASAGGGATSADAWAQP